MKRELMLVDISADDTHSLSVNLAGKNTYYGVEVPTIDTASVTLQVAFDWRNDQSGDASATWIDVYKPDGTGAEYIVSKGTGGVVVNVTDALNPFGGGRLVADSQKAQFLHRVRVKTSAAQSSDREFYLHSGIQRY